MVPAKTQILVPRDIVVAIPVDAYAHIASHSGFAVRKKLHVCAGVIDVDYRANLQVRLENTGDESQSVSAGDRFAQLIVLSVHNALAAKEVAEPPPSVRGDHGFGSIGVRAIAPAEKKSETNDTHAHTHGVYSNVFSVLSTTLLYSIIFGVLLGEAGKPTLQGSLRPSLLHFFDARAGKPLSQGSIAPSKRSSSAPQFCQDIVLLLYLIWMHCHQGSLLYSRVFCDPSSGAVLRTSVRTITCPLSGVTQDSLPDKLIDAVLNDDFSDTSADQCMSDEIDTHSSHQGNGAPVFFMAGWKYPWNLQFSPHREIRSVNVDTVPHRSLAEVNFPELIRQSPVRPPACMYSRVLSWMERQQARLRGPSYNVQRVWGSRKYNIRRSIVESLSSWLEKHQMPITCDALAVNGLRNFQKKWNDGLHENWGLETLWVHPPTSSVAACGAENIF